MLLEMFKLVWELVQVNLLRTVLILFGMWLLHVKVFGMVLFVVVFVNVLIDILFKDDLSLKSLFKSQSIVVCVMLLIYFLYKLMGLWGVIASATFGVLILFIFAGFSIYQNWKVFDAVTTWGAKRIRGKTKKDFDLKEVLKK